MLSSVAPLLCLVAGFLATGVQAQAGPNTMAVYNPNLRSLSANSTFFILPIDRAKLQKHVPYPLLAPTDPAVFPKGFPADAHPVLSVYQYEDDIRMASLEIDSLMGTQVYVPLVDRLGDGKTPFIYSLAVLIGGTNGQDFMGVVPATVGSIEGSTAVPGSFIPNNAAYLPLGSGQYSTLAKQDILPNPVSGPGVQPAVVDMLFGTAASSSYTSHTFHSLLNAPLIQNNGQCQNNIFYFNQTFVGEIFRTGTVTLYKGILPASLAGVYKNVGGLSANPVQVGFNAQSCSAAAAAIKPQK